MRERVREGEGERAREGEGKRARELEEEREREGASDFAARPAARR